MVLPNKNPHFHIKINHLDYYLLGLKLDKYFLDTCLPFGYKHGSAIYQRLTNAIRFIMSKFDLGITNYIDDIIGNATVSKANHSFQQRTSLLAELGLTISPKKLVLPTTKCTCLGIEIDTIESTLSIHMKNFIKLFIYVNYGRISPTAPRESFSPSLAACNTYQNVLNHQEPSLIECLISSDR